MMYVIFNTAAWSWGALLKRLERLLKLKKALDLHTILNICFCNWVFQIRSDECYTFLY